jgi:hypothetical protein
MKKILLILLVALSAQTFAQVVTNEQLFVRFNKKEMARKESNAAYLKANPTTIQKYTGQDGAYYYLHHIDENNEPVYYKTRSNLNLAKSINTDKLWNGGSLSLNLHGQSMEVNASQARIAVFEPNPVRTSHQEFEGRATTRDTPIFSTSDGGTDHATHVACTMVGKGVDADAHGMANQAKLDCYEVNSNEFIEMTTAGSQGILISNHSYGPIFSTSNPDVGNYTLECKDYDDIAAANPNYLQVHAAGNDRDDFSNISYDIMIGGALAKNVAAVGAVNFLGTGGYTGPSSVVMSDFSSYGPADDGRIKPDFCTPGVQIKSAYSGTNTAYATIDGTSMASPGACGSLFLLQQHHKNIKAGAFMKAATLKGLAIHTADEAGSAPGPDAAFGWGLLNMEKAINVLDNASNAHYMEEATLANNGTYTKQIISAGSPFKATISWTDPSGNAKTGGNNTAADLVNDLDIRLINTINNTTLDLPWKLSTANKSAAATKGDNTVDNVEQIYMASLPAGNYKVEVTHKGSLAANQNFSIFISGLNTPVAVKDFYVKNNLVKAYPNPVGDILTLDGQKNIILEAKIMSLSGQIIKSMRNANKNTMSLDFSGLPKGTYLIQVKLGNEITATISIIK